jgi:tetratricopeptide (TPR) repeat protein
LKAREDHLTEFLALSENQVLGKICGSMGQNYAFAGFYEKAQALLETAGKHLGRSNTQQISYRAHLAMELRHRDNYQAEMSLLFQRDKFPGFALLLKDCLNNLPKTSFDLHLILKGMLVFFGNSADKKKRLAYQVFQKINPWLELYREKHPWELVWITLGRLLNESGDNDRALRCWQAAANFTEDLNKLTFIMIGHSARAWEALSWLNQDNIEEARKVLWPVAKTFNRLKQENIAPGIFNPNRISDEDGQIRPGWFDQIGSIFLNELKGAGDTILSSLCNEFLSRFTFNYW